jgi:hypothetical protein
MSDDYSKELREAEIIAGALAVMLWPAASVIDLVTNASIAAPVAAVSVFFLVGGRNVATDFGAFSKAHLAAGFTFAGMTYLERNAIIANIQAEADKFEGTVERKATAYGQKWAGKSMKQWCAANGTGFIGKLVCALDFSAFGGNAK